MSCAASGAQEKRSRRGRAQKARGGGAARNLVVWSRAVHVNGRTACNTCLRPSGVVKSVLFGGESYAHVPSKLPAFMKASMAWRKICHADEPGLLFLLWATPRFLRGYSGVCSGEAAGGGRKAEGRGAEGARAVAAACWLGATRLHQYVLNLGSGQ